MPCILNAANEVAVNAFLRGRIKFLQIYDVIENALESHSVLRYPSIGVLKMEDASVRVLSEKFIKHHLEG